MSETTIPQVIPIPNKRFPDITGQVFDRLTVIGYVGTRRRPPKTFTQWLCLCECGAHIVRDGSRLRSGEATSCGCKKIEHIRGMGQKKRTHGMTGTTEYRIWTGMKNRCQNPNEPAYNDYGGRGIRVCERWQHFESFFADMGARPSRKHTLDRTNNDGDYTPENCRWASKGEQANNRRSSRLVTHSGVTHTVAEWARIANMDYFLLTRRLFRQGWTVERALTTPAT